jgi:glycosyltransferase 2 family protein
VTQARQPYGLRSGAVSTDDARVRGARGTVARIAVWSGLFVSAVFAYLALKDARLDEVWSSLEASDYEWTVPALAVMTCAFFIRALRWQVLFAPPRPPFRIVASALYVGYFFNNILPARAGDAASILALNRRARTPVAETTGTLVIERAFDLLSLLLLLFVSLPWLPDLSWVRAAGLLAGGLFLAIGLLVVALAVFGERPFHFAGRHLERIRFLKDLGIGEAPANLFRGLHGLRRPWTGLLCFLLTALSWLVLAVGFWLVTIAFDLGLSYGAGLLVVIAVGLGMVLPSSPAALGVFEAATVLALAAYGIPDSEAVSFALVLHALNALPFLVLALVLLRPYRGLVSLTRQGDAASTPARKSSRT